MQIEVADTIHKRAWGLLGRKNIPSDFVLVLPKTKQVHGFFMKFDLDIVFVDKNYKVIKVEHLKRWRVSSFVLKAFLVLEMQVGSAEKLGFREGVDLSGLLKEVV
jgi:uncharacterized membrane protein (UPF0127 family)